MLKKTVIFLGSKPIGYECFAYLVAQREQLNIEVVGLLTQARKEFGNGHDLAALAADNGIPVFASLEQMPDCDVIYSVQYHEILKAQHIAKAQQVAVNLHMAPLPEYRGSNQFTFAILEEKKEFGTTIHTMLPGVDNGDIVFQKRFPIPEDCWVDDLYQLTFKASLNLFKQTLSHVITGNYKTVAQDLLVNKYGTSMHYRKEMKALKVIDLTWDKEKIQRYVRATSMPGFEPPYCFIDGERVYFTRQNPAG
ncbi:hypothetical protein CJD36_005665 [Flavipsychrobacter stenotrophus]|uniref:Formyl transferase N-terminal domain-containing protein n=1 Tax=Flavipsychrobacter stenotrophus TaxID=2077091 RepID=A0A2S7SWI2_9BACT|nr:formyltransferase family protein [Flavipsychrobacter stenotrophus]PQJ11290.1 hypothetical protein CJD36_005665 [Flavipsychrobacter stenotrophus]